MKLLSKPLILTAALCGLLVSAGAASAQPHGYGGPGWGPWGWFPAPGWGPGGRRGADDEWGRGRDGEGPGFMIRFRAIDQDSDGVISDDEAAANVESVYYAMDADDDGFLTMDEYMAVRMGPQREGNPERQEARQKAKRERYGTIDADGDEKVSKAEFIEAGRQRFLAADSDDDGMVTPWEFRAQHRL